MERCKNSKQITKGGFFMKTVFIILVSYAIANVIAAIKTRTILKNMSNYILSIPQGDLEYYEFAYGRQLSWLRAFPIVRILFQVHI